ncbi:MULTISPECIES: arsenic resistance N-acetyltransferase ArsN2 [unclassified Caballeronia]|uniref:arsenic resistance N-acetyltransferase ArsN2 n=1 Tax=unclassified Caballeronia TaxID=2646786 RepID=UPI0020292A14|nr:MULTISPECIES: arsenic resistance N-acetyltransferase ArsN2 [unclassified Caballeronia]
MLRVSVKFFRLLRLTGTQHLHHASSIAVATDLAAIEALLEANELPTVGVAEHLTNFLVGVDPSATIACGCVEYHGEFALMRSIVVARDARGFGLGETIIAHLLAACRTRAVRSVVLLTTTAEHYFAGQGFAPVARTEVPPPLLASSQFRGVCPASATTMLKVLKVDEEIKQYHRGGKITTGNFHCVRGRSAPMKNSSESCRNCVRLHIYRKSTSINIRVPAINWRSSTNTSCLIYHATNRSRCIGGQPAVLG